jgi:hypothetical protein
VLTIPKYRSNIIGACCPDREGCADSVERGHEKERLLRSCRGRPVDAGRLWRWGRWVRQLDTRADSDSHASADSNSYTDAHPNSDAYAHAHSDPNSHSDSGSDTHTHTHSGPNSHADADPHPDADQL